MELCTTHQCVRVIKNFPKIFILFIKNNYNNLLLIGIHKKNKFYFNLGKRVNLSL